MNTKITYKLKGDLFELYKGVYKRNGEVISIKEVHKYGLCENLNYKCSNCVNCYACTNCVDCTELVECSNLVGVKGAFKVNG